MFLHAECYNGYMTMFLHAECYNSYTCMFFMPDATTEPLKQTMITYNSSFIVIQHHIIYAPDKQTLNKPGNTSNYPSAAGKMKASLNNCQYHAHVSTQRVVAVRLAIQIEFRRVMGTSLERCYIGRLHSYRGYALCNPLEMNMRDASASPYRKILNRATF
jgi:hypothetical protein